MKFLTAQKPDVQRAVSAFPLQTFGNPVFFRLIAGYRGNVTQAAPLIAGLPARIVLVDGAYDAAHFRKAITERGPSPSIQHTLACQRISL